jgi:hypothetical protein
LIRLLKSAEDVFFFGLLVKKMGWDSFPFFFLSLFDVLAKPFFV